jgi:hypothetical protein
LVRTTSTCASSLKNQTTSEEAEAPDLGYRHPAAAPSRSKGRGRRVGVPLRGLRRRCLGSRRVVSGYPRRPRSPRRCGPISSTVTASQGADRCRVVVDRSPPRRRRHKRRIREMLWRATEISQPPKSLRPPSMAEDEQDGAWAHEIPPTPLP